jgi:hypothetical protein
MSSADSNPSNSICNIDLLHGVGVSGSSILKISSNTTSITSECNALDEGPTATSLHNSTSTLVNVSKSGIMFGITYTSLVLRFPNGTVVPDSFYMIYYAADLKTYNLTTMTIFTQGDAFTLVQYVPASGGSPTLIGDAVLVTNTTLGGYFGSLSLAIGVLSNQYESSNNATLQNLGNEYRQIVPQLAIERILLTLTDHSLAIRSIGLGASVVYDSAYCTLCLGAATLACAAGGCGAVCFFIPRHASCV